MGKLRIYDDAGKEQEYHTQVPDDTTLGGIPVLFRITLGADADANHDVVLKYKTRIIDAWVVMSGDGTDGCTAIVQYGSSAITDTMDLYNTAAVVDTSIVRVTTIDDTYHEIAAQGTLRVATASTGGDFPGAEAYVLGIRVA